MINTLTNIFPDSIELSNVSGIKDSKVRLNGEQVSWLSWFQAVIIITVLENVPNFKRKLC